MTLSFIALLIISIQQKDVTVAAALKNEVEVLKSLQTPGDDDRRDPKRRRIERGSGSSSSAALPVVSVSAASPPSLVDKAILKEVVEGQSTQIRENLKTDTKK